MKGLLNRRLFGGVIDSVILFFGFAVVAAVFMRILPSALGDVFALLLLVVAFLYTPLMCVSKFQGTLGMMIFKLKIVDENGNPPTLKQSLIRAVVELPFALFLGGFGTVIYFVAMLEMTKSNQVLADMAAKTHIVAK